MPTKADRAALAEMQAAHALLEAFGVHVYPHDPEIKGWRRATSTSIAVKLTFGGAEWAWLAPLLRELLVYREEREKQCSQETML